MSIYNGKHVVFEEVEVESLDIAWNSSSNIDGDGCSNNYEIADIRTSTLYTLKSSISADLQDVITPTQVQTAKNGNSTSLITTSDNLFLPAEKEMKGTRTYSVPNEFNALITWNYWATHTTGSYRVKYNSNNTASGYWLRSPTYENTTRILYINSVGTFKDTNVYSSFPVSFAFAL